MVPPPASGEAHQADLLVHEAVELATYEQLGLPPALMAHLPPRPRRSEHSPTQGGGKHCAIAPSKRASAAGWPSVRTSCRSRWRSS